MTAQLKVAVSVSSSEEPAVPVAPLAPSELGVAVACAEAVAAVVVEALAWAVFSEAFSMPSVAAQGYQLTAWR